MLQACQTFQDGELDNFVATFLKYGLMTAQKNAYLEAVARVVIEVVVHMKVLLHSGMRMLVVCHFY